MLLAFLHCFGLCQLPARNGREKQNPREDDPVYDSDVNRNHCFLPSNPDFCSVDHRSVIDYHHSQCQLHPVRPFLVHGAQTRRNGSAAHNLLECKCFLHPAGHVSNRKGANLVDV